MAEELAVQLFDESTQMYRQGNYHVSIALINDCILLQPELSTLYSNRAISNYGLKDVDQAIRDLKKSIEINHLNHVSYFNLFSIYLQNGNYNQAFNNICFSISSICTTLARKGIEGNWIELALRYSFNNKQAIFMKSMQKLQIGCYEEALNLLNKVKELQNRIENRQNIQQLIFQFENYLGYKNIQIKQINEDQNMIYELKTDIICPRQQIYQNEIQNLLKQFNRYNKLLSQIEDQKVKQIKNGTQKSIQSDKMQKQTNCITNYQSNLDNQISTLKQYKIDQDGSSIQKLDKLNLYSTVSEDSDDQDIYFNEKLNSYNLYPLTKVDQKISIFVQQALFALDCLDSRQISRIYTVLHYATESKSNLIKTDAQQLKQGFCKWSLWSNKIELGSNITNANFTIFIQDEQGQSSKAIGFGQFEVIEKGYHKIPFYNLQNNYLGDLQIIIQKIE